MVNDPTMSDRVQAKSEEVYSLVPTSVTAVSVMLYNRALCAVTFMAGAEIQQR
jgi:hypothetical protein